MSAGDSVSAIVKSRRARTTLLQIATDLGIYGDPRLRNALSEDEQRIANYISSILESESERAAVLQLTGDSAQYFLDVVQMTIDRGLLLEKQHNAKARRMIIKLSEACDKLPSSLFISGVTRRDEQATFGGGFGDIYQASYEGKTVALKFLRVFQAHDQQRQIRLKFCREALVWQHLRHPFILPLIGIDRETFPSSLCMVSPWMEHGTILKYLNEYGRANVDKLLCEIAQALQYLHLQNIIHGDLRGANILITPEWSACLADFGLTSLADTTASTRSSNRAGSIRWMAPELIAPERLKRKFVRTQATDVYAFGCVCLELYTGRPPFTGLSDATVIFKVVEGDRPDRPSGESAMSDLLWQHVNDCWTQEPETRPTIQAVVKKLSSNPEMTSMSNAEISNAASSSSVSPLTRTLSLSRYLAITPEERQRRRERGNGVSDALDPEPPTPTTPGLSSQTRNLPISTLSEPPPTARLEHSLPPLPPVSTVLRPTHLKMRHFGSRFLPHTTTPIRCLLPLQADRMLLLGHDEGLSVLDMYPQDWNDSGGLDLKGPEEAVVRTIWEGECVFQMSILELDDVGGVVLMLVDLEPESPLKDSKYQRTLRMYNLGSLISVAKWAIANKGAHPLNLRTFAPQQTPTKKRRPTSSIARALKSLVSDSGSSSQTESSAYIPPLTLHSSIAGSSSSRSSAPSVRPPLRTNSDESSWEMIDDLPLRWARDFVPLASSGSRLLNVNVLSFALWTRDEGARTGSQGLFLAVATKNNIFLYETLPNERAFRFVKEFHTPLQPKAICFFQQTVQELARSPTDVHSRQRRTSSSNGTQLSIFVVFEKRAGWIRLADSASGKIELFDTTADPTTNLSSYKWLLPVRCELPVPSPSVYVFTRGAMTQILPCPLPIHSAGPTRPLAVLRWRSTPVHVAPRVGGEAGEEVLQLTALGEGSVEVLEVPLATLGGAQPAAGGSGSGYESGNVYGNGNGKGKARAGMDELGVVRAEDDAGGETGFLCVGGYWDDPHQAAAYLQHSASISSDATAESVDAENIAERLRRAQGVYGWCRKGLADWRVFWVGGSFDEREDDEEDDL